MAHAHLHRHPPDPAAAHDAHANTAGRLLFAFLLTLAMLCIEAAGGWLSGSLALLADAGHMLVDAAALMLAWGGARLARRPADARRSFGYARMEVLAGYTNGLLQVALSLWIAYEAVGRMLNPTPILSGLMFGVALAGLVVNAVVLRLLGAHSHDDVNLAGARLHVLGDLLGSLAAVTAALLVRYLDWLRADALLSVLVAALILVGAARLLRRSAHILLEGTPEDLHAAQLAEQIAREAGIGGVHHVHVWQLGGGRRLATLHAQIGKQADATRALADMRRILRERFAISHATIQLEVQDCGEGACSDPAH